MTWRSSLLIMCIIVLVLHVCLVIVQYIIYSNRVDYEGTEQDGLDDPNNAILAEWVTRLTLMSTPMVLIGGMMTIMGLKLYGHVGFLIGAAVAFHLAPIGLGVLLFYLASILFAFPSYACVLRVIGFIFPAIECSIIQVCAILLDCAVCTGCPLYRTLQDEDN